MNVAIDENLQFSVSSLLPFPTSFTSTLSVNLVAFIPSYNGPVVTGPKVNKLLSTYKFCGVVSPLHCSESERWLRPLN